MQLCSSRRCNAARSEMVEGLLLCRRKLHSWFRGQGVSEGSAPHAIRLCEGKYLQAQRRPASWNWRAKFKVREHCSAISPVGSKFQGSRELFNSLCTHRQLICTFRAIWARHLVLLCTRSTTTIGCRQGFGGLVGGVKGRRFETRRVVCLLKLSQTIFSVLMAVLPVASLLFCRRQMNWNPRVCFNCRYPRIIWCM